MLISTSCSSSFSGKIVGKTLVLHNKKKFIMSAQRILIAALSGFVAGVAVGLMVAPASGSEIRQRIADSAGEFADDVKEKIRNFRSRAEEGLDDLEMNTAENN
jgi:gas vesicle protein